MRKSGKASTLLVIILIILMIIGGVFFAYKKGYIKKEKNEVEENNTKSNITINKVDNNSKEKSNKEILEEYKPLLEGQDCYALTDLNNDGVVDLITHKEEVASDKIIAKYKLYSYNDGKVVQLGTVDGRKDNTVFYKMNDNTILFVYGHMGYETTKTYIIENNKLVEKSSNDRTLKFDEEYVVGDTIIPFDFVTDTIQFEMYE